ncbi:MAG: hypothetical protein KDK51_00695 [Deltaproteobacteria bacterium]|nr:hypothetical protein [Deltaproteobacteria bacterium]
MSKMDVNRDFQQFQEDGAINVAPQERLQENVLRYVKNELNPSHTRVFSKLLAVHAFIGTLTLTLCPQFSMSLTHQHHMFHYFHHTFGKYVCMFICGTIFIGTGAVFAAYLLKKSEVLLIRKTKWLYYTSMSMIAVLSFILLGADVYLPLALCWFAGASISGIALFDLNYKVRQVLMSS